MSDEPLNPVGNGSNGNGRGAGGRFAPGNRAGKGNPLNRKAQRLRNELLRAVSVQDVRGILRALVDAAKAGDVQAAEEVLDRTVGKASEQSVLERVEQLERLLAERGLQWN